MTEKKIEAMTGSAERITIEALAPVYGNVTHAIRQHLTAKDVEIDRQDSVELRVARDALADFDTRGKRPVEG